MPIEQQTGRHATLDELPLDRQAHVVHVLTPEGAPEWARWLSEIGFIPGEPVRLLARGRPGGEPLVVRIGDSTFALRRAEAGCVQVAVDELDEVDEVKAP